MDSENSFFAVHGERWFMDSANEHFTYPWTVKTTIHVQLDELV